MLKNLNKTYRLIIIIILMILLIAFLFCGYVLIKDYSARNNNPAVVKDNEIVFKDYLYTIPKGWKINDAYPGSLGLFYVRDYDTRDQVGAIIDVRKVSSEYKIDTIFKDLTFFKEKLEQLKNDGKITEIGEEKIVLSGETPVVYFPCFYGESSKFLFAFMPAYDDYYYSINFYSSKRVDGKEVMDFNSVDLFVVVDFLKNKVKVNS